MNRNLRRWLGWLVLAGSIAVVDGCASRSSTGVHPATPPKLLRVLTWNIRHGEGVDGRIDLARLADLIRRQQPDLVALQEVDRGVARTARRDLPAELATQTGLIPVFRRNIDYQGGEYGNAILSRWPVIGVTNHAYRMLRAGEQRAVLRATVEIGPRQVEFWSTHLDSRPDDAERRLNAAELIAAAEVGSPTAVVLCGDFNDFPASPLHRALGERFDDAWERHGLGPGFTFPTTRPDRRIDYVWIVRDGPLRVHAARVLASEGSDHLPLLVELEWLPPKPSRPGFSAEPAAASR